MSSIMQRRNLPPLRWFRPRREAVGGQRWTFTWRRLAAGTAVVLAGLVGPVGPARAQRTTLINIDSTPPGATVWMDTKTADQRIGQTPIRRARLPRGNHVLIFELAGHQRVDLPVEVTRRRETYRAVLQPVAQISVVAGNPDANSAAVVVDGEPVGNVPTATPIEVTPGRHQITVRKEGFEPFSQWMELRPGQVLSLPVVLQRSEPETGELLVASDVPGASVFLDGQPKGTAPTLLEDIPPGTHEVVVRSDQPGLTEHRETVTIIAGQRQSVSATLRARPSGGGTLRILSSVPETIIELDGEVIGQAPLTQEGVSAGNHIVAAVVEGYQRTEQEVRVVAGEVEVVSLRPEPVEHGPGAIVVRVDVDGATVIVDGGEPQPAPVVVENVPDGQHAIVVQAPGHEDYRTTCRTGGGESCELDVELEPVGALVRVNANVRNASLFIDGAEMGPIPFEGHVPAGSVRLVVRAPGYQDHVEQVLLAPDTAEPRAFDVTLIEEGALTAEERDRRVAAMTSRSAAPLLRDQSVLDLSLGWPYHLELRLGVGILEFLDAGFAIRTVVPRFVDFEARVKAGKRVIRQISLGGQVRIGGGLGPSNDETVVDPMSGEEVTNENPTNTFFLSLEALGTLHFSRNGAFTLFTAFDLHVDRWDFTQTGRDLEPDPDEPQTAARWRFGGTLEVVLSREWNVSGTFEGILFGDERRILGDIWNQGNGDGQLYFRLGTTYKF